MSSGPMYIPATNCYRLPATPYSVPLMAFQALQIFGSNKVDLVLLDFMLQAMDGGLVADAMKDTAPTFRS